MTETANLKKSSVFKRDFCKAQLYKYLRNDQFSIMPVSIMDSPGLYGNTRLLLWTFTYDVLWNLILVLQEVKGLLEECVQEESNYHYINCMKRVRSQERPNCSLWNYIAIIIYIFFKLCFFTESRNTAAAC